MLCEIYQNAGFLWPEFSCIRTGSYTPCLYGKILENLFSGIFYLANSIVWSYLIHWQWQCLYCSRKCFTHFFYGSRLITYYISICIIICTIKTNTFINKAAAMLCLTLILTLSGNVIIYCTIVLIFFLFPTDWRKANIILVYKRSDKQIWKNTIIQHHYSLFMVK